MLKRILILMLVILIPSIIFAQKASINIEKYQISKITKPPIEYTKKLDAYVKVHKGLILGKNWKLPFDSKKYLESKITGKKANDEETFVTSSLLLNVSNKKIIVDKDCFGYGKVAWNTKGDQFIYQRIEYPPTDYPVASVYLVKIKENGEISSKKEVIKKIGHTDFTWSNNSNIVAFSDFDLIYILDTDNNKMIQILGDWSKGLKGQNVGKGYPRWCNSFIWLNQDKDLVFSYRPNMYDELSEFYKITFE